MVYSIYCFQLEIIIHFYFILFFHYLQIVGNAAAAKLLIKNCASLNLKRRHDEYTPLHIAAEAGISMIIPDMVLKLK